MKTNLKTLRLRGFDPISGAVYCGFIGVLSHVYSQIGGLNSALRTGLWSVGEIPRQALTFLLNFVGPCLLGGLGVLFLNQVLKKWPLVFKVAEGIPETHSPKPFPTAMVIAVAVLFVLQATAMYWYRQGEKELGLLPLFLALGLALVVLKKANVKVP